MKNNIIELSNYRNTATSNSTNAKFDHCRRIWSLIASFVDMFATLSIGVCTVFCMYLAYTML